MGCMRGFGEPNDAQTKPYFLYTSIPCSSGTYGRVLQLSRWGWAHAQHLQANKSANIDRLFPFRSKRLTHPAHSTHGSHLNVGDAVGSTVGVCDGDQLDGAGDGVIVGGNVNGAALGAVVGAGDGDELGDGVHAKVLHAACSVVNGHGTPVPSEVVVTVRWRLEIPPPPANARWGRS